MSCDNNAKMSVLTILVYEIFQFLKHAVIVIRFLSLLIVMEFLLWNRKER